MRKSFLKISLFFVAATAIISCGDDDNQTPINNNLVSKKDIIANYANIAYENYKQAYDDAVVLKTAINAFTTTPTEANFTAAKDKWKLARESYGTTEAFRFANGPIDTGDDAPEGLLNAWPLDENYIDYVDGNSNAGIINDLGTYPNITTDLLVDLNEAGDEKNISTGYHAIEFLLWGQDLTDPTADTPGLRPYTDFVDGGTAANQDRRRAYLNACADLLIEHLGYLVDQWQPEGEYRTAFLALNENEAIKNIYLGITTLVMAELPVERMEVALANANQEDEHSCFSDNTHRDIFLNMQGVINIYEGKYGAIEGASLQSLVNTVDPFTGLQTNNAINAAEEAVDDILTPFDHAISGGAESTEGAKVQNAVVKLKELGSNLLAGATKLGINVNG
ncbi:imelysin family protein [Flavobacterium sp.]|uniref:imelysin family protein n=1 Tax=Flavobacterium sp. TaxID=239 RepID=UPI0039E5A4C0